MHSAQINRLRLVRLIDQAGRASRRDLNGLAVLTLAITIAVSLASLFAGQASFIAGGALIAARYFLLKKYVAGLCVLGLAMVLAPFGAPIYGWLSAIGVDSLSEAQHFELQEAIFFLSTIPGILEPEISINAVLLGVAAGVCLALSSDQLANRSSFWPTHRNRFGWLIGLALAATPVVSSALSVVAVFQKNSDLYRRVKENFSQDVPPISGINRSLDLVVYIGEASSAMHMSLYGYPRDTTPNLKRLSKDDPNFLVFSNVFSTHTHTSPSLLAALSLRGAGQEPFVDIYSQRRLSIVDILRSSGYQVHLVSNQGQAGTWNLASSVLFRNAVRKFSTSSLLLGNNDGLQNRPFDHEYLIPSLEELGNSNLVGSPMTVFLHSYAGHGDYAKYIPEAFRTPIDGLVERYDREALVGDAPASTYQINDYDAAMKYVDHSVASTIDVVRRASKPMVLIYFSDHGESTYTGRAHDSSRFTHEMARVPFVVYFNDAARVRYPELFSNWKARSESGNVSTLEQLSPSILDLLGLTLIGDRFTVTPAIGEGGGAAVPIVVRRIASKTSYVGLQNADVPATLVDASDDATSIFRVAKAGRAPDISVCYHSSNTWAKAIRGANVADCLMLDVVLGDGSSIEVMHPSEKRVGLDAQAIWNIAKHYGAGLWISAHDISAENCTRAVEHLRKGDLPRGRVLVEFPSRMDWQDGRSLACAQEIKGLGLRTSFQVPTEEALKCAQVVRRSEPPSVVCDSLDDLLEAAVDTGAFTDFSFDYNALEAMQALPTGKRLSWSAWNVRADILASVEPKRFFMVAAQNSDPNSR